MPCIAEFCVVLSAFQGIIFFLFKTTLFAKYFKWFKGFEMPYKCKLYYTPTAVVHRNHHFDTRKRLHPLMHPPKYRRCITLHPGIGSGYSSFYGQLQSSLFFHEKRDINAPGSISLPFFIIQLSGLQSFPLTSCAFSALFLSRCSIASCFHTFPHLRLSEATQNPCPLCRLSSYRGTR